MYGIGLMPFPMQLLYALALIPFLYFISFILYKILSRVALFRTCCSRLGEKLKARRKTHHLPIQGDDYIDRDLPDRIVNPDMYKPLLSATNSGEGNESQSQAAYGSM